MRFMQVGPIQTPSEDEKIYYRFPASWFPVPSQALKAEEIQDIATQAATLEEARQNVRNTFKSPMDTPQSLRDGHPMLAQAFDAWSCDGAIGLAPHVKGSLDHPEAFAEVYGTLFGLYAYDSVMGTAPERREMVGQFLRIIAAGHLLLKSRLRLPPQDADLPPREHARYEAGIADVMINGAPDLGFALPARRTSVVSRPYTGAEDEGTPPARPEQPIKELAQMSAAAAGLRGLGLAGNAVPGKAELRRMAGQDAELVQTMIERMDGKADTATLLDAMGRQVAGFAAKIDGERAVKPMVAVEGLLVEMDKAGLKSNGCRPIEEICLCELLNDLDDKHSGISSVRIMGVGDVYRLDVQHDRYERGQLVHTEPVLGKSEKSVSFNQTNETETTFGSEEVNEETRTTEAVSEERFRLEIESEAISKEDNAREFGVSASLKYGPVQIGAAYGQSNASSQNDRTKSARETARETTSRAATEIRKKTTTTKTSRNLVRTERDSGFTLDNKAGASFTGYYHAIDQVMTNQLKLIGRRVLVRSMFERPMAFLMHCLASGGVSGDRIDKPIPPDEVLTSILAGPGQPKRPLSGPKDITPENFDALAGLFNLSGLEQPPRPTTVSLNKHGDKDAAGNWPRESGLLDIPKGYRAVEGQLNVMLSSGKDDTGTTAYIDIMLGQAAHENFKASDQRTIPLNGEQGTIPWSFRGYSRNDFTFGLTILCDPTETMIDMWRAKVFDAIWQSYHSRQAAFESKVSAAAAASVVSITGRNPLQNLNLIREELMKLFIGSVCPAAYYRGLTGSLKFGTECEDGGTVTSKVPVQDFMQADEDSRLVSFLMRAFEFEAMTWRFHPYFAADRSSWCASLNQRNPDPVFEAALRAGAAEVDVPVRPGYENAVAYFLEHHEPWEGGDIPPLSSPLSQGIALELAQMANANETDAGDPWEEVLPTSLLMVDDTPPHAL